MIITTRHLSMRYASVADGEIKFHGNPLRELWSVSARSTVSLVVTTLTANTLRILFPLLIALILKAIGQSENIAKWLTFLCAGALSLFFLTLLELLLHNRITLAISQKVERLMTTRRVSDLSAHELESISLRDIGTVLDEIPRVTDLIALPLFLAVAIVIFGSYLGLAGISALLILTVVLPGCFWLAKAGASNVESVMQQTALRIERCSKWLKVGPRLKQFGAHEALDSIRTGMKGELESRDRDSLYRGIDSYLVGFGRILPAVGLAIIGSAAPDSDIGVLVWLSTPLLAALLGLPRSYVSFRSAKVSLQKLNLLLPSHETGKGDPPAQPFTHHHDPFLFNEHWPIWPGPLRELLPQVTALQKGELQTLAEDLRLIPELGRDLAEILEKDISADAQNLSNGQRCRLQLLRGILLAKGAGTRMKVNREMPSLDDSLRHRVLSTMARQKSIMLTGPEPFYNRATIVRSTPEELAHDSSDGAPAIPTISGVRTILLHSLAGVVMFMLPAGMLAGSAVVTTFAASEPFALLVYAIVGTMLGGLIGVSVERRIRERYATKFLDRLRSLHEDVSHFSLHVAGRDMTNIFERIAWYSQDIAWVGSLVCISWILLVVAFGKVGIGISGLMFFTLMILYASFIDVLVRTRSDAVLGINALIRTSHVTSAIVQARRTALGKQSDWLDSVSLTATSEGMRTFFETRSCSIAARTFAAASGALILRVMMVIIVIACLSMQAAPNEIVLAVSALLFIQSDFSNAFRALTGLKSQVIAVDRLEHFCRRAPPVWITSDKVSFTVEAFRGYVKYRSLTLSKGRCYSLDGSSGSGKTIYMKTVADVIGTRASTITRDLPPCTRSGTDCYYIDPFVLHSYVATGGSADESNIAKDKLLCWIANRCDEGKAALFLLDEVFGKQGRQDLPEILTALEKVVSGTNSTVILVDHRLTFPSLIRLDSLIAHRDNAS